MRVILRVVGCTIYEPRRTLKIINFSTNCKFFHLFKPNLHRKAEGLATPCDKAYCVRHLSTSYQGGVRSISFLAGQRQLRSRIGLQSVGKHTWGGACPVWACFCDAARLRTCFMCQVNKRVQLYSKLDHIARGVGKQTRHRDFKQNHRKSIIRYGQNIGRGRKTLENQYN